MKLTTTALLALASATGLLCTKLTAGPFQTISVPDPSLVPASASGDSTAPLMTPNGRYVVFSSTAANIATNSNGAPVPQTFPAKFNVFLRDRTAGTTTWVSANQSETNAITGDSLPDDISTNGQFVVFESSASDLVPNDTNNVTDIFLRDTINGTTSLISVAPDGTPANGASHSAVMTPDGRYVAFVSAASNLVSGDLNNINDIFLRDTWSNTTALISVGAKATTTLAPFTNSCEAPEVTPDGRYVAFYSTATNLVAGISNSAGEIYVRDTVAGTTLCASFGAHAFSTNSSGAVTNTFYDHCISADGQYVAYEAKSTTAPTSAYNNANGLVLRYNAATDSTDIIDTNAFVSLGLNEEVRTLDMTPDGRFVVYVATVGLSYVSSGVIPATGIKVWDAQTGTNVLVSANIHGGASLNYCGSPSIDPSGRFVTFISDAPDLISTPVPPGYHCYIHDLQLNTTTLVDVNDTAAFGSLLPTDLPRLSADGRYVAFQSFDSQLVPGDSNRAYDIFLRDVASGSVELISARESSLAGSATASGLSILSRSSISGDDRFVAFSSLAENLVTNDHNNTRDIFVRDLLSGSTRLVSVATNGVSGSSASLEPAISADGRYVVFASFATNIAPVTVGYWGAENVYLADLQSGTTTLISKTNAQTGNYHSFSPVISRNGTFVLFHSKAYNLAAGTSGENLFLYNVQTARYVALTTAGVVDAAISADGHLVVFSGSKNGISGLFTYDTQHAAFTSTNNTLGTVKSFTVARDGSRYTYALGQSLYDNAGDNIGTTATFGHYGANFSADGNLLAYGAPADVKIYNFATHNSVLVSHSRSSPSASAGGISDFPDISADGRYVVYRSTSTNLVSNVLSTDTNGWPKLIIYDTQTGTNKLFSIGQTITITNSGLPGFPNFQLSTPGNGRSFPPLFSADGRTIVFSTAASDLVDGDFNQSTDLFEFAFLFADVEVTNEGAIISWPVAPGQTYHVQYKNNVDDSSWQILNGTITITGNRASITDPATDSDHRIYRVAAF